MSSGILDTIKRVALNAFEASNPVKLLFGKVISTNPVKIQVGEYLTLTREFLVINGAVSVGDSVTLIRCQGGQKYVVLGTRTQYVQNTIYVGGGTTIDDSTDEVAPVSGGWQYPFTGGYTMTSPFGEIRSSGSKHRGVDIVGKGSKLIYPINTGKVVLRAWDADGYGNYVVVDHGNNYWSLYAHMSSVYVKMGQSVTKETIIGVEGSTGHSTGSHLHLEVRKGANTAYNTIDPLTFLSGS